MGPQSSKDVGFDWWKLAAKSNWTGIERLIETRPETLLHPWPDQDDKLLLHHLCSMRNAPEDLIIKVIELCPSAPALPDGKG